MARACRSLVTVALTTSLCLYYATNLIVIGQAAQVSASHKTSATDTQKHNATHTATAINSSKNETSSMKQLIINDHLDLLDYDDQTLMNLTFVGEHSDTNYVHHNYDALTQVLHDLQKQYPSICRVYSIGQSQEGRQLWTLQIQAPRPNVTNSSLSLSSVDGDDNGDDDRPEFRYVANIHGNEVVGRELLLLLARLLLHNYNRAAFVHKLLNSTRIHLVPSLNPDGYERAQRGACLHPHSQRGRINANNYDINRNFPDPKANITLDAATQRETRATIEWSRAHSFVLSASLHGGALVASYPFDGATNRSLDKAYSASPDDKLYATLARVYSMSHPTMHRNETCYDNCSVFHDGLTFADGITNGAQWYSLYGGLQDWSYLNTNALELTLELGCHQYPEASQLYDYWQKNKLPLLKLIVATHHGVAGKITDSKTGKGIGNCTVHLLAHDNSNNNATTGNDGDTRTAAGKNVTSNKWGHYWRILLPGIYTLSFEEANYRTQQVTVNVLDGPALELDIQLERQQSPLNNSHLLPVSGDTTAATAANNTHHQQQSSSGAGITVLIIILILLLAVGAAYVINKSRIDRQIDINMEPRVVKYG